MPVIKVKNLTKTFSTKVKEKGLKGSIDSFFKPKYKITQAVNKISFEIEKGESVAFIGPNGAGKSTTLKMLTGILYPTSGELEVLGFNPQDERKKLAFQLGSVFGQKSQLWYHLPPIDTYELFANIYNLDKQVFEKRLKKLVKQFDVKDLLQTPVRKLSLGQRMRCELVAAMLHNPKVLLLDEPTIGLDLISKKNLRQIIKEINEKEGITIILTSHDLADIETVCNRIVIINNGKIIYDNNIEELKHTYLKNKIVKIQLGEEPTHNMKGPGIKIASQDNYVITYEINTEKIKIQDFINQSLKHHKNIKDIAVLETPIEDIIEEIYNKK